jgi:DNA-binding ferritin-like protein (Dps family)
MVISGSGHGKGVHDGVGVVLKWSIKNEQMKMETPKLQTAADVVAFCLQRQAEEAELYNQHKNYKNAKRDVLRYFHLIYKVDRRKKYNCKYFKGVQSLHSVVSVSHRDVTFLKSRHLACFCKEYMDDNSDFCGQKMHVKEWRLKTLEPKNLMEVYCLLQLMIFYCLSS